MMSGAVPPWNCVTSWSCTLSQVPCVSLIWMSGFFLFQASTMSFVAATVESW
jgi:hypothetical protein